MVPAESKPVEESWQDADQLAWLEFWQRPWCRADVSWFGVAENGLGPEHIKRLSPYALRQKLLLDDQLPPNLDKAHLGIVQMDSELRHKALLMVAEVVKNRIGLQGLEPHNQLWCLRLAKALTPSSWPISSIVADRAELIGQALLRQWLSESLWCRARLLFPREQVLEMESWTLEPAPSKKVTQLWQAVLWRMGDKQ